MSYLRNLCLFAHSGVQHISCCVFVLFFLVLCTPCWQLSGVQHILCCVFVLFFFVLCTPCCQLSGVQHILCCVFVLFFLVLCIPCRHFLWIIHFWLPLRFSIRLLLLYTTAWIWDPNKAGLTAEKYGHYELQPKSQERPSVLSWLTSSILVVCICSDNWNSEE